MSDSSSLAANEHPVLIFDGTCMLCDSFFKWVVKKDGKKEFRFATLQSEKGKQMLTHHQMDLAEDTVFLNYRGELLSYSSAALRTMILLGGLPKWAGYTGLMFPKTIRDFVYRFIAKNRYKWFGTQDCLIPTADLKARFMD